MSSNHPDRGTSDFPIVIIGAGFAGLGTAIKLKQAGIDSFCIIERAGEIGGTWRDNSYPGAACDVPSHVYSFSFEQNPEWSRSYAGSAEIQGYLLDCTEKYGLRAHLRLNTEITEARFDESAAQWSLETGDGETLVARAVVSCVGGLVDPAPPDVKGIQCFEGEMFHTARWNHAFDLGGRKVAVIGTGASAVQVVPAIAPQVERLSVFQRTPGWVMPKLDAAIPERRKARYRRSPLSLSATRRFKYLMSELFGPLVFLDAPRLKKLPEMGSLRHLRASVSDPELRRKLTPDFQFGCKRILISDDYWSSFERENVELVTDPIAEIVHDGIVTKDCTHRPMDAIILATGFAVSLSSAPFPIYGRGGRELDEVWEQGATAYKGVSVHGFPNWFIMMGPNTGPGHTSVLIYTEAQIRHTVQAIKQLRRGEIRFFDVRKDVQERYNEGLQKRMKHMVWSSGCNSWYLDADGGNHALFPGFAAEYALRTRSFHASDYEAVRA